MAVHFFHTSDWHLGQLFYNHARQFEHEQFLTWLIQQIKQKQPHALLISGDIYDVINPSSMAQKQLYQFLAEAHAVAPDMQTLMIAGNHDSGYRIEQIEPLLEKYNAKTVGLVRWHADRSLDIDRLILPIYNPQKDIVAWCIALPFLRNAEIIGFNEHTQDSQSAIEYLHETLIAEAKKRKTADQALIIMSHAHIQGGQESDSERCIIGNQEALSTTLFDHGVDYVALGHLHKPQQVSHPFIRYSGSPIPLSFSEKNYKHQVVDVHINPTHNTPEQRFQFSPLYIPRSVAMHRLTGELEQVMQQLKALPSDKVIENIEQREYVDIEYHSNTAPPLNLRQQIEDILPSEQYRLVRLSRKRLLAEHEGATHSKIDLAPPTPAQLFAHIWQDMGYENDAEVNADFLTLLEEAEEKQRQNNAVQ
ncbi:exonuclease SbcCD subunit D [Acinetobacter rathckeae]|uniref:exonuclease SbcCD subunit D n=1 Tax=Acinetobacter rathckeae TaxID=2605272 RepID=UPI0018A250A1|nr:exonuclease SbcCD subunit D C-terminal domain-containing protein [Acinetobacter rathckeae]MBF7688602.1 exonuclease SbcCD subunit D C-terminal domain-containing protein [Acinetobacter rathckeae]MBF7695849.1 exonuclease SbcCD subunit D C-terminal domain-containing protein [Acinetobacter rathckeae]